MSQKAAKAVVTEMPPLRHAPPVGQKYHVDHSQVIPWLIAQETVKEMIFQLAKDRGWIVYDPATEKWSGALYDETEIPG